MFAKIKIIATLGPATNNEKSIEELIDEGVNVFRLNFSYGSYQEHEKSIKLIREAALKKGKLVGILQDICGPKIRIKGLEKPLDVKRGDRIKLAKNTRSGGFSLSYPSLIKDLKIGDEIYFADGQVKTKVVEKEDEFVILEVLTGGKLLEGKGINIPEGDINLTALTEKDKRDIEFGAKAGVDFVAVSFVSRAEDIKEAREILKKFSSKAWIVAKIERKNALSEIDSIIEESDAVMVARGDLGAEMGLSKVPLLQKEIIRKCNIKAKPVITATQMLTSMINSPYPTRAEISDIANAILDGTDAVMLSDETAIGHYPKEAIKILKETIFETQKSYPYYRDFTPVPREAFPYAAAELSKTLPCDFIASLTLSGYTLLHTSKFRPKKSIYAITPDSSLKTKTTIVWGVADCIVMNEFSTEKELVEGFVKKSGLKPSSFLLVTGYLGEKISKGKSVRYIKVR